jgi:hypothetical protein
MPTTVKRKLSTAEAAKHASVVLGLDDLKRLGIALAEAAADEATSNRAFAEKVRLIYSAIPVTGKKQSVESADLVPIKKIPGRAFDPSAPLDPYFLLDLYGQHQLSAALEREPLSRLKEAVAIVEQRYPGTRPKNKAQKASNINYILELVK